jgi:hypothetical protein
MVACEDAMTTGLKEIKIHNSDDNLFVSHFDSDKCDEEAIHVIMNCYHNFVSSLDLHRTSALEIYLIDFIKK